MTLNSPDIAFSNLRSYVFEFPTGCFKNSPLTKLPHPIENILLPHVRSLKDFVCQVSACQSYPFIKWKILKANDFVIAMFHRLVPYIPVIQNNVFSQKISILLVLSEGLWFESLPFLWIPLIAILDFLNFFNSYMIINNEFSEQR